MKVLVTGVNGQLGHDIVEECKKRNIEAIGELDFGHHGHSNVSGVGISSSILNGARIHGPPMPQAEYVWVGEASLGGPALAVFLLPLK